MNAANQITIVAPEKATYSIYNAMGQKMDEGKTTSNHQTTNSKLSPGVYVVRVSNDGKELTSSVIVK